MSDETLLQRARRIADDQTYCGVDAGRTTTCHAAWVLEEMADEIERLTAENNTQAELLKWLRSASPMEIAGYRDGYDSLAGDEVTRKQREYGQPYTDGFMKGISVSPLIKGAEQR